MNKNKKMVYLLVTLAGVIWGLVGYKVYTNLGGKRQMKVAAPQKVIKAEKEEADSLYTLSLDYPDPFLKGDGAMTDSPAKVSGNPKIVNWPGIEYRGSLTSKTNNESTAFLKIQSSNLLVKQGKEYLGMKVLTILKDSICVEYKGERRWIGRVNGGR